MALLFSTLEQNILKAKGLTDAQLQRMSEVGIASLSDFATVGNAATFGELVGVSAELAQRVFEWAIAARPTTPQAPGSVVVESPDAVYCVHCKTKQPKDYQSGDLCGACGRQAEPTLTCFWCAHSGPGKFCRHCGAEFVSTGELELAVQLKRDGLPKDAIAARLRAMSVEEKDVLWGRIRRAIAR
jgi:hypothetical protein